MRQFRFPRSAIFLMLLILATTVIAIERARDVSQLYGGLRLPEGWLGVLPFFVTVTAVTGSIAALGYGVLYVLHRSGAQRFLNIRTWGERR
jgi:hypothetical protein